MAAVKTKDDYDVFSRVFGKTLAEINNLVERGWVEVEGLKLNKLRIYHYMSTLNLVGVGMCHVIYHVKIPSM